MAASLSFQQAVTNGSGGSSPLAFTCASAAGQERLVALCGIGQSPITSSGFTSVTIDGQTATQVGSTIKIADSGGNGPIVAFFRAPGTSGTSINVAFTKVGTFFDARGALWTLSDAGTLLATNSDTGAYSGSGNLGDANLNVNTAAGGAAAAIFLGYSSGTRTATWTGLTERYDGVADALYSGDWFTVADLNVGSASTPLTVTATLPTDFSGGSAFASLAVSFNPAEADTDTDGGTDGVGQQIIDIGDAINDGTGDPARVAFDKSNQNFTELYKGAGGTSEGLWNFHQTSTDTSTAPVSGRFKTNSGNYRDATQIAIHATTIQGVIRADTLRKLLIGDIIQCQDSTNSAAWCRYILQSAPIDNGDWFQLNVADETDGGVTSGDNQEIVFVFTASKTGGGGNVSNSGTPTAGQYGKWVTATTIEGVAPATVLSDIGAQAAGSYQPLDADLTAIAALAGTDVIYYRSGSDTWSPVTISTGLTFTGGTLAAIAGQTYYFDPTDAADVGGYKRLLLAPSSAAESTVVVVCTGTSDVLVGSFITDPGIPGAIEYPAGSAYRRLYASVSAGVVRFHIQIYARTTGGVETLARDEFSQNFANTTAALIEWLATPSGASVSATDRIVVKVYAQRVSGSASITVTFYAEGSAHASQVQTTIPLGGSAVISANPPLSLAGGSLSIDLSAYATLAGPTFTGDPKAPTPTAGDNDTSIATTAFVTAAVAAGSSAAAPGPPQGRLTLQTATPVMITTQSAKTTTFYTPYCGGDQVPIYNGTSFTMTTFAELSNLTTASATGSAGPAAVAANSVYDLFVWSNSGTMTLTRGPAWTNDTTRSAGTALVRTKGIWLNNAAITNGPAASRGTYVGTVRSNASSQIDWTLGAIGTAAVLHVWNAYNRADVTTLSGATTDSWAVTSATFLRGDATNTINFVSGLAEDGFLAIYDILAAASASGFCATGVGYDSTTTKSGTASWLPANFSGKMTAMYGTTALGRHFVCGLETSGGGTATFYGDLGVPTAIQTGIWLHFRM